MLKESTIKTLIDNALEEREDLFLIGLTIATDNKINIIIDGDNGVSVEDCIFMSRAIENNLDRELEDFSLEVASAGATAPMVDQRQYKKNIGRILEVKAKPDIKVEAKLVDADADGISLEWSVKEPKLVGKGKVLVNKQAKVEYKDILEAKVIIKF